MPNHKLYMLLLGCRPKGRHTEQHDVFFTIARTMHDCIAPINEFWPEAKGNIHIDAWREVTQVDGYEVKVVADNGDNNTARSGSHSLFFINLGGYKEGEFEEYHYKMLTVADSPEKAKTQAKQTAFYKHVGFKGAPAHIDDKYGVDADDMHQVEDILPVTVKGKFSIEISATTVEYADELHLGYLPLFKIPK